mmetsp:Transcript_18079/g.20752  ORF Transcript_18079/g.20752 Transcript_18079/m.20752 type:complete len:83 (-) Transcript_18079:255-503(-)
MLLLSGRRITETATATGTAVATNTETQIVTILVFLTFNIKIKIWNYITLAVYSVKRISNTMCGACTWNEDDDCWCHNTKEKQ